MKILFIINPKSGKGRDPQDIVNCIKLNFPQAAWALTTGPRHATELAAKAVSQQYEAVVAVGGDGTINETAQALVNTPTALGVIPGGSGNGFARELRMPLHLQEAVFCLQKAKTVRCDVGQANGELFLNLAGVGIEAQIAYDFMQYGKTGKRGMWPYFKLGAKDAFTYQPQEMQLDKLTSPRDKKSFVNALAFCARRFSRSVLPFISGQSMPRTRTGTFSQNTLIEQFTFILKVSPSYTLAIWAFSNVSPSTWLTGLPVCWKTASAAAISAVTHQGALEERRLVLRFLLEAIIKESARLRPRAKF